MIKTATGYCLVDWRQGFGTSVEVGDRYYDLAKFLHTLNLSVETMARGRFAASVEGGRVASTMRSVCRRYKPEMPSLPSWPGTAIASHRSTLLTA